MTTDNSTITFLPKPTIHNFIDLTGQTFHYLTVLGIVERIARLRVNVWLCRCKCGKLTRVRAQLLRDGSIKSCGCWNREATRLRNRTHGLSHLPEYAVWETMRKRCNNPRSKAYPDYGGRGITVCPEWDDFAVFFKDMGSRPTAQHQIERVGNNGNYCADNCIWALPLVQANNKRNNHHLTLDGETKTSAQWARILNIKSSTIRRRKALGWSDKDALTTPLVSGRQTCSVPNTRRCRP